MEFYGKIITLRSIIQIRSCLKYINLHIVIFKNVLFMYTILWLIFSLMYSCHKTILPVYYILPHNYLALKVKWYNPCKTDNKFNYGSVLE